MTFASDEKWRIFNCFFCRVGLRIYQPPVYIPIWWYRPVIILELFGKAGEIESLCSLFIDNFSNRLVSNSCFLIKKKSWFVKWRKHFTVIFMIWGYFEVSRSRSGTVWNSHSGTEEGLKTSVKNTIFLKRPYFHVQNLRFWLGRRRIKAAEISHFLLIMQYNYTEWHKKNGNFEKPNKNWRNPRKKNYWQKLNHYNLPFKRQ